MAATPPARRGRRRRGPRIPAGYDLVDPRTARRVPLWHELLLLTGFGERFGTDAYFAPAPGFGATRAALSLGGITVENVGPGLARMRAHGDWVSMNPPRPRLSGFATGITGFTRG